MLDTRALSARELTEAYLERIERLNPIYHGYVVVDAEGARQAAAQADADLDAGVRRGPLHGIPICVKDHLPVAGLRMRMGSGVYDFVSAEDADVVARARAGGAVLLGKNGMHEEAIGDPVRDGELASGEHPHNAEYTPGGSSSGTAVAIATGLALLGVGGDTGGSVRGPAASCGIAGLKPTYGRISAAGAPPFMWSADHVGLFGRDVAVIDAGLAQLADAAPVERSGPPRLLALHDADVASEVAAALADVQARLAGAGATVSPAPALDLAGGGPAWAARAKEAWATHGIGLAAHRERFSPFIRGFLDAVGSTSAEDYEASWRYAERLRAEVDSALASVDALLLPATPKPALRWEEWGTDEVYPWYRFLFPFNLSGHPAVTLPCASAQNGVPIAFQLVGRHGADEELLALARWCEAIVAYDSPAAELPAR